MRSDQKQVCSPLLCCAGLCLLTLGCLLKTQGPTADEMMADFLGTYSDDDTGSSTDSNTDSDQEIGCEDEDRLPPSTAKVAEEKPCIRTGLTIILPPRRLGHAAAIAEQDVASPPTERAAADAEGEGELADFGYDSEMEDEVEETEYHEYAPGSPARMRRPAKRMRSPLSVNHRGILPVYAAYRCAIEGCDFSASSAQHLRHHLATASHSLNLRRAGTRLAG